MRTPCAGVGDVPDALPDESATTHKPRTYGMQVRPEGARLGFDVAFGDTVRKLSHWHVVGAVEGLLWKALAR